MLLWVLVHITYIQYPLGPTLCYLHTEGLKAAEGIMFREYKGRLPQQSHQSEMFYEAYSSEVCCKINCS